MQRYCETLYFVNVSLKPIQFPELMDFLKAYLNFQFIESMHLVLKTKELWTALYVRD